MKITTRRNGRISMGLMTEQISTDAQPIPDSFLGLQEDLFPLRPIHSKADYKKAIRIASDLASRVHITREQSDYFKVLTSNVKAYEDKRFEGRKHAPLDILKFLVSENGMSGSDLGRVLGNRTSGPAILRGMRSLSKAHIRKLADHFSVEPGLFL